jgi:hypothetical protein
MRKRGGMVNEHTVNPARAYDLLACFCEFFPVSGRFLRFKTPVKYGSKLPINYNAGSEAAEARPRALKLIIKINNLSPLKASLKNLRHYGGIGKRMRPGGFRPNCRRKVDNRLLRPDGGADPAPQNVRNFFAFPRKNRLTQEAT